MKVIIQNSWRFCIFWVMWAMTVNAFPAQNPNTDNLSKIVIIEARWSELLPELVYSRHFISGEYLGQKYLFGSHSEASDCYSRGLAGAFAPRKPEKQFVYEIKVRNESDKQIAALDWEYIFSDPENGEVVERHSFHTQERIYPRKSKTLIEVSISPPTRIINVRTLKKTNEDEFTERIVVKSVVFADGSVWIRPDPKD